MSCKFSPWGETNPKHQGIFDFGQKSGLEIDHQANPATNPNLIDILDKMFLQPADFDRENLKAYKAKLRSVSLHTNGSFKIPQADLKEWARSLLEMRHASFKEIGSQFSQATEWQIKEQFAEPLFHFIGDLGVYYGMEQTNTLDLIDVFPCFNEITKALLKQAAGFLYNLRVRLHLSAGALEERASQTPSHTIPTLTQAEINRLQEIYKLLLKPLYGVTIDSLLDDPGTTTPIDLLVPALRKPNKRTVMSIARFTTEHSAKKSLSEQLTLHQRYYDMLQDPRSLKLRKLYIRTISDRAARSLSVLPNRAGFRESRRIEMSRLQKKLKAITTSDPASGVQIVCPLLSQGALDQMVYHRIMPKVEAKLGEQTSTPKEQALTHPPLYLTREAASELIVSNTSKRGARLTSDNLKPGHIKKQYLDSLHNVASTGGLHFKERPFQPLMEALVHSLTHRILGAGSPPAILARIEIAPGPLNSGKERLIYPVQISETVQGERLTDTSDLDLSHLTHMRLCEILTKPLDGRISNYLIEKASRKVYCIDADVSLGEPVLLKRDGRKITFCSALFTLDPKRYPFVEEALVQFSQLEPDLIIADLIQELLNLESHYRALFPKTETVILKELYEKDRDRLFTPSLLLPQGTLGTLCLQFYRLQDELRDLEKRKEIMRSPLSLLRKLVSLKDHDNTIGPLVEREYSKALALPFPDRLMKATHARHNQSVTSKRAMEINYKKIPTFEEACQETFSLAQAYHELCLLEVRKNWDSVMATQHGGAFTVSADFTPIDPQHEEMILRGLCALYELQGPPVNLSLRHTKALTTQLLQRLLHPKLESLDLSYAAIFSEGDRRQLSMIEVIEMEAPNLKELHLEGCPVKQLRLTLKKLKILNTSHAPYLEMLAVSGKVRFHS